MTRRSPAWHPRAASICSKCGALVSKKQKHKKWHKRMERLDWTGPMGPQGPAGPMGMSAPISDSIPKQYGDEIERLYQLIKKQDS